MVKILIDDEICGKTLEIKKSQSINEINIVGINDDESETSIYFK